MRKKIRSLFIDDQASEGYSSEEEVEERPSQKTEKQLDKQFKEMLERRDRERARLESKLQELMKKEMIDNSSSPSSEESYDDNDPVEGPKIDDPKVWRFRCGRSKVALEFILKIVEFMPKDCKIVSIFFNPNIKGLIFFEAYFESEVQTAMRDIMYGQPTYVEPDQCPSLLEMQKNSNLQLGQWVRLRKHRIYGSDLGRVMRINPITNIITLKVIRRNKNGQKEPISWQRENQGEIDFQNEQNSEFIYSDIDKEYKCAKLDGFALLKCNVKNIDHNISINDEELQMFFPDVMDRKILVQQAKRELRRRVDVQFKEGQYVRLIGEDDMNSGPKFKIMKIFDDNMIELMCRRDNREFTYLVHASEIRLAFKLYQEVKVVEGPHKGDVGVIISIKQGYIVLTTDYGTYKVPHSVLQFGHKDNTTQNELVRFGNGDFQIGCVLESKLQTKVILTINNDLQEIPHSKIEILNFNKVEMNSCGECFKPNDNVRILDGKYANKFGLVKHCINGKLFLFNNLFPRSVILESVENCTVLVSKADHFKKTEQKQLLGLICTIKQGKWSGYRGQIINIKQNQLMVQLQANNQKVVLQESDLTII